MGGRGALGAPGQLRLLKETLLGGGGESSDPHIGEEHIEKYLLFFPCSLYKLSIPFETPSQDVV